MGLPCARVRGRLLHWVEGGRVLDQSMAGGSEGIRIRWGDSYGVESAVLGFSGKERTSTGEGGRALATMRQVTDVKSSQNKP